MCNGEIAAALAGHDAADQAALDRCLIELDGTPAKTRLGANATLAVSLAAAHAAAASAGLPLYRYLGGDGATTLPLPQIQIFGGGAHAGRRVDVQDFMVVCPGATSFAQALEWTAEVYRAAGQLMQRRGALHGVADEGGWWPDFDSNEQALQTLVQAIETAGYEPGAQVAIALDVAASEFGRAGRYRLALEARELDADGMIEMLLRWIERYPIVSIEDPLAEDDLDGFARFTQAARSQAADRRRRPAGVACAAAARGRGRRRCQLRAAQAQPARHVERDAGVLAGGAPAGLCGHRLGALWRERGHQHRASGARLGRGTAEGGFLRTRRAHGQVERGAAHRAAPGRSSRALPAPAVFGRSR